MSVYVNVNFIGVGNYLNHYWRKVLPIKSSAAVCVIKQTVAISEEGLQISLNPTPTHTSAVLFKIDQDFYSIRHCTVVTGK